METWNSLLSLTKGMIKMSKIYYLAYGSNLNKNQMAYRCPNAKTIGSMMLKGYELVFKSCLTIEPNKDGEVPLGIWQITKEDEKRLDRYEGYPILYRKEYIDIVIKGKKEKALVYIMNDVRKRCAHAGVYMDVCMKGYKDFKFDIDYLNEALLRSLNV